MVSRIGVAGCAAFLACVEPGSLAHAGEASSAQNKEQGRLRIILTSVFVDDQAKAVAFYTEVLGFVKKQDFPVGKFRWLTVVSPLDPDGVELLLEPNDNPAARTYQKALFEQGIPVATFGVEDLEREHERLQQRGAVFRTKPTRSGPVTIAVLEDTCGNLIQLAQTDNQVPQQREARPEP